MPYRTLAVVVAVVAGCLTSTAQDLAGTSFTFTVPINFREPELQQTRHPEPVHRLAMTARKSATVVIRAHRASFDTTVVVAENTRMHVDLPTLISAARVNGPQSAAIEIRSSMPISVTYLDSRLQTTDAMAIWPDDVLGTTHRLISRPRLSLDLLSSATITATENGTTVSIVPSTTLSNGMPKGTTFSVDLDAGRSLFIEGKYEFATDGDLSGTLITANKRINVITSHACAYVPSKIEACNVLLEQAPPLERWGTRYIVPPIPGRAAFTWKVVSHTACTVRANGTARELAAGMHLDHTNDSVGRIVESTEPILIALYGQGFRGGDSTGDPFMTIIPPVTSWTTEHDIALPATKEWDVYCTVMGTKGALQATKVNGAPIDEASIKTIDDLAYAHVRITSDLVLVRSPLPVGALVSAVGETKTVNSYDAYGLSGAWRTR
jgi:hypothetical protein